MLNIISVTQHPDGEIIKFTDGVREYNGRLNESQTSQRSKDLRELRKAYEGDIVSQEQIDKQKEKEAAEALKKRVKAKIDAVNKDLKELGARQIKNIEEVENAKAFILVRRAEIFADNEGA